MDDSPTTDALERERAARKEAERIAEEVTLEHAALLDGLEAAKEEVLAAKREILQLSTLVLPIWSNVLLMPIIGRVDRERADLLCRTAAEEAVRGRVNVFILDLQGVPSVDRYLAQALLRFHQTLRLVGCKMVLSGVRANVAQNAITHGDDAIMSVLQIPTCATLSEALKWAIDNSDG